MYLLGLDIGSSTVKASLVDAGTGMSIESSFAPKSGMEITSNKPGWAEQNPDIWWHNILRATREVMMEGGIEGEEIIGIGISYQMHGLVMINKQKEVIHPAIIWCDSRAADIGQHAFTEMGAAFCLNNLLNSPGNFTASKLQWVKKNNPSVYEQIYKVLLPGDYIAMKLTGEVNTTIGGLSEGIFWDFKKHQIASELLDYYQIDKALIPDIVPVFGIQGLLKRDIAEELGLKSGTPITYRAGDQANNAYSLQVTEPGQLAATASTSGVVYGVTDRLINDSKSRVNVFAHVNHQPETPRLGVLLCLNGTGILNQWLKNNVSDSALFYEDLSRVAKEIPVGSDGLVILPFGNGAERMLENKNIFAQVSGLCFNIHRQAHLFRAAHEGIAFALSYGLEIMKEMGLNFPYIRASKANMFHSPVFRETLSTVSGTVLELYNTEGSQGAARAAGVGLKCFSSEKEAFSTLKVSEQVFPDTQNMVSYQRAYEQWKEVLQRQLT